MRWHRAGFKLYWTWLSRHRNRLGRKSLSRELRELIFRMVAENTTWGVPRIRGELKMLGFDISERSVLRWMRKAETVNISLNISILKWSGRRDSNSQPSAPKTDSTVCGNLLKMAEIKCF